MDDPDYEESRSKKKSAMSPSDQGKMHFMPPKSPGMMSKICSS